MLAGLALLVADHDDLVVTEEGGEALWTEELPPAWGCAVLVPAPSAGSWPPAIWMASPPAIAADAIREAATSLSVTDLVEGLLLRWVTAI